MCNITIEDAHAVLAAVINRAIADTRTGTEHDRTNAESFLTWICPTWREWPLRDQPRAATIAAQRLAGSQPNKKRYRNGSKW